MMENAIAELASSLRDRFKGEILEPSAPGFEEASRIWNSMASRTPGLIARCRDTTDVQAAVLAASAAGIHPAVRCGGHSLAGFSTCEGGMVIDLSPMREVTVDENARRARFAGGCLLGSIDVATQRAGLVFPSGVVSHTGASGLVLGGGTGWLTRLHGLSCDNVEGFTAVTAEGSLIHATSNENPDLFWALRGGGGNFGVVVEFEVKLHPLTSLVLAEAVWTGDDFVRILEFWRDYMPTAPDELKWNLGLKRAPKGTNGGRPVVSGTVVWFGEHDQAAHHLNHIFSVGKPTVVKTSEVSYLALQTMADHEFPHGRRYYTKSGYFGSLSGESIDLLAEASATIPSASTQIELAYLGGAAGRVSAGETAFGDRSAPFIMNILADWDDAARDDEHIRWVRDTFRRLRPAMKPGVYVNFMSGDEDDRTTEAYRDRWERLVDIKTKYDPGNFFRLNQNIRPRV